MEDPGQSALRRFSRDARSNRHSRCQKPSPARCVRNRGPGRTPRSRSDPTREKVAVPRFSHRPSPSRAAHDRSHFPTFRAKRPARSDSSPVQRAKTASFLAEPDPSHAALGGPDGARPQCRPGTRGRGVPGEAIRSRSPRLRRVLRLARSASWSRALRPARRGGGRRDWPAAERPGNRNGARDSSDCREMPPPGPRAVPRVSEPPDPRRRRSMRVRTRNTSARLLGRPSRARGPADRSSGQPADGDLAST